MQWGKWLKSARAGQAPPVEISKDGDRWERFDRSVRELELVRLEWAEVLDKITAWTARQSARDAKAAKRNLSQMVEEPPGDPNGEPPVHSPTLTKIELRRAISARNGGTR